MRVKASVSKNSTSLSIIRSTFEDGLHSSKVVESLGNLEEIASAHPGCDPWQWARERAGELTRQEREDSRQVLVAYSPGKLITKGQKRLVEGGYLFLQRIYHDLGLGAICDAIVARHKFTYDLDGVLSRLVFGRILDPASKLSTFEYSKRLIEPPCADLQHVYRALDVIAKESDFIQSELYKASKRFSKRSDGVLYYDCTNYYFEIECEDGIRQYGPSKENRPNPIVEMGLFMDTDGVPLAFSIHPGNTNEQLTLKPLEERIIKDFEHSRFVVCTDAGLSSSANRRFNSIQDRSFITTQSIKKLKKHLKAWALDPSGWKATKGGRTYDITELDEDKHKDTVFYKERWINDGGLEQRLIVTFSLKYKNYQRTIRSRQIQRAQKLIDSAPKSIGKPRQNDFKRLIATVATTTDGEIAEGRAYTIDGGKVTTEEAYDGFYGVCTNLTDSAHKIAEVNRKRWEIEECFRIMKHEFKARPVYLRNDARIEAHFATCFIALIVYRTLERKLEGKYTCAQIIDGLEAMKFLKARGEGYIPAYTRTAFTDDLHAAFGFRTDYQLVTNKQMKKIIRSTKR
ncbi:MAG: IS1634 family transposase [Coriobacteriales bacterium]|jgi:transposase|nr:IS1634 family transposase [Coriobacteriales bacterium]